MELDPHTECVACSWQQIIRAEDVMVCSNLPNMCCRPSTHVASVCVPCTHGSAAARSVKGGSRQRRTRTCDLRS